MPKLESSKTHRVQKPEHIRKEEARARRRGAGLPELDELLAGIRSGDRVLLGRALTLVESQKAEHQPLAQALVEACLPQAGRSVRVGVSGAPGVGKSTFIEAFGSLLLEQGHRLCVLAIDPSSSLSKGSILGDKTRMPTLATHPRAFVRPSPAGDTLGGVARKTRESILLCEAAGFDLVVVETVGVGQSETAVHNLVDFFLLLLQPGAGDELQGIKRGIVELADMLVVNKADGERLEAARRTAAEYRRALHLFPPKPDGWTPPVRTCSALERSGLDEIWQEISGYLERARREGHFEERRRRQAGHWFHATLQEELRRVFFRRPEIRQALQDLEAQVLEGRKSPFAAARELIQLFDR